MTTRRNVIAGFLSLSAATMLARVQARRLLPTHGVDLPCARMYFLDEDEAVLADGKTDPDGVSRFDVQRTGIARFFVAVHPTFGVIAHVPVTIFSGPDQLSLSTRVLCVGDRIEVKSRLLGPAD